MNKTQTRHIAALAFPFGTHASPLLDLVQRISSSLPDAKFSFFSTAQSNNKIFINGIEDNDLIKPYNVPDGLPEGFVFRGNPEEPVEYFLKSRNTVFWDLYAARNTYTVNFKNAMEKAEEESEVKISCLLTDSFFWFAGDMAEEMNVPWIALWTSGPHALFLHVETEDIREKMGFDGPKDKTLNFFPAFSKIRAGDMPEGIIFGRLDSTFSQMVYNMGKALRRATATATNSFVELDSEVVDAVKSKLKNFLNIGPFILTTPKAIVGDGQNCLDWLDKQKPTSVVYISFGSIIQPPLQEIVALSEALEESKVPFLWSFKGNAEELLPKGFMERIGDQGRVVPWTPQLLVLLHSSVGVFVTHCGWNSILESINGGVPLICRSFFGDQHLNKRIIEAVWKIGVGVEGNQFTKDRTMKAFKTILFSDEGEKMRERILEKKDLSLKAVVHSGSSTTNFNTLLEIVSMPR